MSESEPGADALVEDAGSQRRRNQNVRTLRAPARKQETVSPVHTAACWRGANAGERGAEIQQTARLRNPAARNRSGGSTPTERGEFEQDYGFCCWDYLNLITLQGRLFPPRSQSA